MEVKNLGDTLPGKGSRGSVLGRLWQWFEFPHRFHAVRRELSVPGARVLDVGCGNHSPALTKKYFPSCVYHGLDRGRWNHDAEDDAAMDHFFGIDLDAPEQLDAVGDGHYDVIICSHVLEHVPRPEAVAGRLIEKLKPEGALYIEVPSERSLRLPRASEGWFGIKGCLNFYDDKTHVTMVRLTELREALERRGCVVTSPRYRLLWRRVLFLPLYVAAGLALRGYIPASVVWDITGFAQYIVARRDGLRHGEIAG